MAKVKLSTPFLRRKPGEVIELSEQMTVFVIKRGWGERYTEQEPEMMDKMIEPKRRKK